MEEKLEAYRRKKRSEKFWNRFKYFSMDKSPALSKSVEQEPLIDVPLPETSVTNDDKISITSSNVSLDLEVRSVSKLTVATYLLYGLLWITVFMIAVQLGFGAVYIVLSMIFGIYFNTRTGPKREGEVSAYSVFNPKCESIDGTLKAEHFEKNFGLITHSPNVTT